MVKTVFDALDVDGSGLLDEEELFRGLAMIDPEGIGQASDDVDAEEVVQEIVTQTHVGSSLDGMNGGMENGGSSSPVNVPLMMDLSAFERFLIKFMQDRVMRALEPYVNNHALFVRLGGRDLERLRRRPATPFPVTAPMMTLSERPQISNSSNNSSSPLSSLPPSPLSSPLSPLSPHLQSPSFSPPQSPTAAQERPNKLQQQQKKKAISFAPDSEVADSPYSFSTALADGREEWEKKGTGEASGLDSVRIDLTGAVWIRQVPTGIGTDSSSSADVQESTFSSAATAAAAAASSSGIDGGAGGLSKQELELKSNLAATEAELQAALEEHTAVESATAKEMEEMGDALMEALAKAEAEGKRAAAAEAALAKAQEEGKALAARAAEDEKATDELTDKLMKALAAQHTAVLAQREAEKALERAKRDSIAADVADDVAGAAGAAAGAFAAAGSAAGALLEVPTIEVPDFLAGW
jgi:hypothetical protein